MRKIFFGFLIFGFAMYLLVSPSVAQNRGYTIQTPGQLPTYITPNYGGGYTVQTPGQLPTYINPR